MRRVPGCHRSRDLFSRGANVAAVNYHFGDKLGLYTEILKSAMMAQHAIARTGAEFADPRGELKALIFA